MIRSKLVILSVPLKENFAENFAVLWSSVLLETMNLGPRGFRYFLNLYPPYLFSRTRVRSISPDWREIVVELPKSLLTRNYVGTTFGGSLYAASDPFYMLMLVKILGIKNYIIWDKEGHIEFLKPARTKITYRFVITDDTLAKIRREVDSIGKSLPEFYVEGTDSDGNACVRIRKKVYIRRK